MDASTTTAPTVLTAEAIAALPEVPLGSVHGVAHRVLWRGPSSMAGVLTIEAGHHLSAHANRVNHHHMWVLEGHALILGVEVGPGSYVHVPAHVDHDIEAPETERCTVFYLYEPPGQ
jgi:mannose-6-phosphate isomerase-like protein (cupin superfamily)